MKEDKGGATSTPTTARYESRGVPPEVFTVEPQSEIYELASLRPQAQPTAVDTAKAARVNSQPLA